MCVLMLIKVLNGWAGMSNVQAAMGQEVLTPAQTEQVLRLAQAQVIKRIRI